MRRRARTAVLIFFLLTSLVPVIASAQDADPRVETLSSFLEKRIEKVDNWRQEARWILILTLAVIGLGGAASALQVPKNQTSALRASTAIIGVLIVCLGSVKEQIFQTDRHTLTVAAGQAEKQVEAAQLLLDQLKNIDEPALQEELIDFFQETLQKIDDIEEELGGTHVELSALSPEGAPAGSFLATPAFAQAPKQAPNWVTKPPENELYLYFVGTARSESLTEAKELSYQRALDDATTHLALELASDSKASLDIETRRSLTQKFVSSATVEDTSFALDPETKIFRFDTLLRVSRNAITRAVEFYTLKQPRTMSKELVVSLQEVKGASASYRARESQTGDMFLAEAREALPPEHFERFLEARSRLRNGDPKAALESLRALVKEHENFYLGWRELARAEAKMDDAEAAVAAFERAVALEEKLTERDPSVYVDFGRLRLKLGDLTESREQFATALHLEPEQPEARLGMLEVEQALAKEKPKPPKPGP